jgi:hypothetical protein
MKRNTTLGGHLGTKVYTFTSYQLILLCGLCRLEPTSHKKSQCPYKGMKSSYSLVFMTMHQPMTCDGLNFGNHHLGGVVGIKGRIFLHMELTTTTTSKYNKPRIFLPPFYISGSWFTLFQLSLHILNKMRCVQCFHILRTNMYMPLLECL